MKDHFYWITQTFCERFCGVFLTNYGMVWFKHIIYVPGNSVLTLQISKKKIFDVMQIKKGSGNRCLR